MFNDYNETPHNPSNECNLGKEKKTENVAKLWCGSSNGNQQVRQQANRVPEFWSTKTNFIRMQKCNCSDCYSSDDTPSYQNSTSRHRPWLPKTFSVPTNNSNELSKLPGYQWENCLFNKTSYGTSNIPNLSTKELGGKYPYHRLSQPNQPVVVPAVRNQDLAKKPKDEVLNEMGFYDLYRPQQQVFCNPAWNLSKTFNNSDLYNLNEKYQNANTFKHSIIPHSEQHAYRAPVVEPYAKVVPFFQNRVPSTGHQSFKNDFSHFPSELNFNNAQKTQQESNEFLDNKNLRLSNNQMGREVNNIYPSHDSEPNLKSNGMVQHYAYNLPYKTSYDSENQKFSFGNLQEDNSFCRKNVIKSSGYLEPEKQWQINQTPQHFSDGSLNKFKNSFGVLNSETCKDNKILKSTLNDQGGPLCAQLHEGIVKNDGYWLQKPGYSDSRAANYFPCQNDPSTCRNYTFSDYPPLGCSATSRHEQYISVTQEKPQCQFTEKNYQSTQNYGNNQITYNSTHTPTPNHFFQQPDSKSTQQQYLPYKEKPIPVSEQSCVTKTDYLEAIRNENVNQNKKNTISPLRLLRKKKNLNQSYLELPTKNLSGEQTLDVRKFFSTWAEEEEENETPTQVLVLDCQNLDPEQTKFLYLYENNGIVTLKSADSVKDPDTHEGIQESKEDLLLNIGQGVFESIETEDVKKQCETFVQLGGLEPQSLANDERRIKSSSELEPNVSDTKTKLVNQENCFDLIKKPELNSQNKVVPSNIANESENLDKWEEKLNFFKVSEDSKTEISQNKEEQEKIVETQNFLLELSENEMLASNLNSEFQVHEDNNKGSLTLKANVQTEINDGPALPTCEFRRNKFLNYTKQNIDVSLKKSNEVEAKEIKDISERIKLDKIACQEKDFLPSDKTNSKLILKSGEKVVDDIVSKLSEINFEKSEVKVENESLQKKVEASHNKKIKKSKRIACESENDERNEKVTVDKIKFSIQKSHDLKISFKVLNSAAPKSEDKIDKTEENTFQANSNEESRELITLKLKSIQNADFSENNRKLKKKKLKKDNQKIPVVKIKNSSFLEEKKPAFKDEKLEHCENVIKDSSFQTHSNDFHVKETVDSAKIKLTFKRHKSKSEAKRLENGRLEGLENKSKIKWKKMKRREKGVESIQSDLNCTRKIAAEIKTEPEKDNDVLPKEENIEFLPNNSSVQSPDLSSSSNVPFSTNDNKHLTNRVGDGKDILVNQLGDTQVEFFENVKLETLDIEKEDNIQIDESAAESVINDVINDSSLEILSNGNFVEEDKNKIEDISFDCNIDMNSKDVKKPYEFSLIEESHLNKKEKERDTIESKSSELETQENVLQKNNNDVKESTYFLKEPESMESEKSYKKLKMTTAGQIKKENDEYSNLGENSKLNRVAITDYSEIIVEKLGQLENQFRSVNQVDKNESFSRGKAQEFSNVADIGMRDGLSEIFKGSCDLNSKTSENPNPRKNVVSKSLNSNFSINVFSVEPHHKKHETSEDKVIEVINSISNKIQCFDSAKKICYDENEEKSFLKCLQRLENSEEANKSKSCDNFCELAEKLSDCSFAVLETVEEGNFFSNNETPVEVSSDYSQDNQSVKSIYNEIVNFTPPSSKISDVNVLKSNGEGQSTEAIQAIYKVSTNSNTLPHDKEGGEELKKGKLIKSAKVMHGSLIKTTDLKNFSLKSAKKELSKQQDSIQKIEIKSKFKSWCKKPVFKSYKIKRRHSFVQTFNGCDGVSSLNFSTRRFVRFKSCPPRVVFSSACSTPHLDIPVQDIPLPAGNPLPENIFDFKKYFLLQNKMSTLDTKNCSQTKNSSLKTQEKSNFQKMFKNWKKEKEKKNKFENRNLSKFKKEVKLPLKEKSKIKFSLSKLKNLKTFFTEKENENLPSVNREPKKCDSSNIKSEHSKDVVIKPVTNENDCLIGVFQTGENRELEHINADVKMKCKSELIVDLEKSEFIFPSVLDDCREDLSNKIECDWELQIAQEIEEESVILTELSTAGYIENEFYKCEDIPTSEDLTNGEEVTEDQKVSDDDKFRNIMQNCLENAKKFLNEGNVKLPLCPDNNTPDLGLEKPNINKNEILEVEDNSTSQNIRSVVNDTFLSEIFQQDCFSSFENSHNLYSEELPVDNWPYLEEEVQSSPLNNSPKIITSILTNENDCSQISFEQNVGKEKSKSISKSKHFKRSRCKSLPAEMNSVVSNAQQIKQRRRTLHLLDKHFWSYQKVSNKVIQQIRYQLEKYRQKSISPKVYSSIESVRKIYKGCGKSETIKAFDYKSSKWQPKVLLHRISEAEEKKGTNDECDSSNIHEIIELKQTEQKPHASVQMLSNINKNEGETSSQYLKVSPDIKYRSRHHEDNLHPNFGRDSEIKKRKKSRFRNLYSKEKRELKLPHDQKTSFVADPDKYLIELPSKTKLSWEVYNQEKRKNADDKSCFEKKDKKQKTLDFRFDKNGFEKETGEKVIKQKLDNPTNHHQHHHHHSKRSKHKLHRDHKERKDTSRPDSRRRSHSSEKPEKPKEAETQNSGDELLFKEPWVCQVCGFSDVSQRVSHIKSHPFHCQSCHLAFKAESFFVNHLTKKHKGIRNQHHCLLCELSFDTERLYLEHLETREHRHLEAVEKNTINTLFTLLTGQPCPVLGVVETKPDWLPNQAGTVHFYHQATPLSLALQYLKMRRDISSYANVPSSHFK